MRRILFIGDLLWEARELVPELAKIAEVQSLDLHPHLPQPPIGLELKELVVRVLSDFARRSDTAEPDVLLFYLRPALLSDEVFTMLRQKWACPLFGMNLDEKTEFLDYGLFGTGNDNYASWAKKFDLNLSNVRAVVDWYADRNLPVLYVPEG